MPGLHTKSNYLGEHMKNNNIKSNEKSSVKQKRPEPKLPRRLKMKSHMKIQTKPAIQLLKGREIGVVGLFKFCHMVSKIWHAARADDPYADVFLLRIFDSIVTARRQIETKLQKYRSITSANKGIEIEDLVSKRPETVSLQFGNPYGFMAAYLLTAFDELICLMVSLQYQALLDVKEARLVIAESARCIRQVFSKPLGWRPMGLVRKDVLESSNKSEKARALMGDIHHDVLHKKLRAPYAPRIELSS